METKRLAFFLLSILILLSHVVIPWFGRADWGPFFTWNLFSRGDRPACDAKIQVANSVFNLSDPKHFYASRHEARNQLWQIVQRFQYTHPGEQQNHWRDEILDILRADGGELLGVCCIEVGLAQYMSLSSEKKKDACGKIF